MAFAGESIQSKLWGFIVKYKKYLGFGLLLSLIVGGWFMISNLETKKKFLTTTEIIINCQNLEKEKKYNEAYEKLQEIYNKYDKLLKKNPKFRSAVNLYNYKLAILRKNSIEAEIKIKNTPYVSQWYHYNDFSIAGEIELTYKMLLHYKEKNFEKCDQMFFDRQMMKLPNFVGNFYRSLALFHDNKKDTAKEFLAQSLYKKDYVGNLKEIIKNLFFLLD